MAAPRGQASRSYRVPRVIPPSFPQPTLQAVGLPRSPERYSSFMEKTLMSGFSESARHSLRADLEAWVRAQAKTLGHTEEAVVQELRYWQQSGPWRTNPTKANKTASFKHWNGLCSSCKHPIESLAAATFHHLKRGVRSQHGPENMVPLHRAEQFGCHEKLHAAPPGSFTAGSRKAKSR